ncbi:MAG: flippase [bacterium]
MSDDYQSGKITKNTGYLIASYIGQNFLSFIFFIILARFLGVEDLGKYVFAFSFATLFSIAVDLNLSQVLTREIAKFKDKAENYLNNIIAFKLITAALTYLTVVLLINFLNYPDLTKILVYLTGLVMILDSFSLTFYGALRGIQNLKFEALSTIYGQLIIISLGTVALFLGLPLPVLIVIYILASLFKFIYSFWQVKKNLRVKFRPNLDKSILKLLFALALPFALAGIFNRVFYYTDTIFLSKLIGDVAVGIYSIAYKLTYSLQFIPAALGAALFPAMSSFYLTSPENLKKSFEKSFLYLSFIALPITFGTIALAPELIKTLYSEKYLEAILPLQLLIMAVIFIFLNYPIGSLLNACDRQKANTFNVGIAMAANIILNIILIPRFSYVGAAISGLVSQTLWFVLGLYQANKLIKIDKKMLGRKTALIFLSAVIMFFMIVMFKKVNWLLAGGFSTIFYLMLIIVFRVIKIVEIKELISTVIKKT